MKSKLVSSIFRLNAKVRIFCGAVGVLFSALFMVGLGGVWQEAQGISSVQLFPTRVVFEGRTRSTTVSVINPGEETTTYRITFKNMRMKENGAYEDIEEPLPGEQFASDYIRYSPRQVVLEPGESQVVRLLLRKKRDMEDGEYRSHLYVVTVPPKTSGESLEKPDLAKDEISIQIIPIFGITIPVIVRQGKTSATVELEDLALHPSEKDKDRQELSMMLHRQGNRSVYGNVNVTYQSSGGGEELEVGRIHGIAVFTPNETRKLTMQLNPPEGVDIKKGKLHVVYREPPKEGGGLLAESELSIP